MTVADKMAVHRGAGARHRQRRAVCCPNGSRWLWSSKAHPGGTAVGVLWNGVEIIRDEFSSLAREGQLRFTVAVMWDFENVRTDGFTSGSLTVGSHGEPAD